MDQPLISTTEELHHILLLKMILLKLITNTNQTGDGILDHHTTMDLSQTSTPEEPLHTPSPTTTSRLPKLMLKLQHSPNTNQTGDGILDHHTTMDLSQTSTLEEPLHTPSPTTTSRLPKLISELLHLPKRNTSQTGDGIPVAHITTVLSPTSTLEELHHTPLPTTIFKLSKKLNTSQTGDGIAEVHTTMDHSLTLIPVERHHTLSPMTISKSPKLTLKLQHLLKRNTSQTGDGILDLLTTMGHSLTSTVEELPHTLSPTTIELFNQKDEFTIFKDKNLQNKYSLTFLKINRNLRGFGVLGF